MVELLSEMQIWTLKDGLISIVSDDWVKSLELLSFATFTYCSYPAQLPKPHDYNGPVQWRYVSLRQPSAHHDPLVEGQVCSHVWYEGERAQLSIPHVIQRSQVTLWSTLHSLLITNQVTPQFMLLIVDTFYDFFFLSSNCPWLYPFIFIVKPVIEETGIAKNKQLHCLDLFQTFIQVYCLLVYLVSSQ